MREKRSDLKQYEGGGLNFEGYDPAGNNLEFEDMDFRDLLGETNGDLIQQLFDNALEQPTKIQNMALQVLGKEPGSSLKAKAPSGTGKTIAFLLCILKHLSKEVKSPQAICLAPQRELIMQIKDVFDRTFGGLGYSTTLCVPDNYGTDDAQIIFALPNALQGKMKKGKVEKKNIKMMILDEADEIIGSGRVRGTHFNQVKRLIEQELAKDVLIGFFSATYNKGTEDWIKKWRPGCVSVVYTPDASVVQVKKLAVVGSDFADLNGAEKFAKIENERTEMLLEILKQIDVPGQIFIFVMKKEDARHVSERLNKEDWRTEDITGDLKHEDRDARIEDFKRERIKCLVTTDMLARGIDVPQCSLVVNFGLPKKKVEQSGKEVWRAHAETFYHRCGRAGRAGREGYAVTFVSGKGEYNELCRISRQLGLQVEEWKGSLAKEGTKGN